MLCDTGYLITQSRLKKKSIRRAAALRRNKSIRYEWPIELGGDDATVGSNMIGVGMGNEAQGSSFGAIKGETEGGNDKAIGEGDRAVCHR